MTFLTLPQTTVSVCWSGVPCKYHLSLSHTHTHTSLSWWQGLFLENRQCVTAPCPPLRCCLFPAVRLLLMGVLRYLRGSATAVIIAVVRLCRAWDDTHSPSSSSSPSPQLLQCDLGRKEFRTQHIKNTPAHTPAHTLNSPWCRPSTKGYKTFQPCCSSQTSVPRTSTVQCWCVLFCICVCVCLLLQFL